MKKVMDDQLHFKWKNNLWNNYCRSTWAQLWNINGLPDQSVQSSPSFSWRAAQNQQTTQDLWLPNLLTGAE